MHSSTEGRPQTVPLKLPMGLLTYAEEGATESPPQQVLKRQARAPPTRRGQPAIQPEAFSPVTNASIQGCYRLR